MTTKVLLLFFFWIGLIFSIKAQPKLMKHQNSEAQKKSYPPSMVDYDAFSKLTKKVEKYRQTRIIDAEKFVNMLQQEGVLLLDTRSAQAFKYRHIKGAINLPFSDFTEEKLASVIPSKDTPILIYCNNNFLGDPMSMAKKSAPLALNIPTFINLYGYGYKNIYELGSLLVVDDPCIEFEGEFIYHTRFHLPKKQIRNK